MKLNHQNKLVLKISGVQSVLFFRKKVKDDQFLISPLTGEKIAASKAAEHMKVDRLIDSLWKDLDRKLR